MRVAIVIPARYASTRLPGKPLADLAGKPMIAHVCERARAAPVADAVVVATDHEGIALAARAAGARALLTSPHHRSGTDRVAEAVERLEGEGEDFDVIVNLQGDEPLIEPALVAEVVEQLGDGVPMATLARSLRPEEAANPAVVKVAVDRRGRALFFSRAPIGGARDGGDAASFAHLGIYAFVRPFLTTFTQLGESPLERAEGLEQLRALEHGYPIAVGVCACESEGVDTPEDLERIRARLG
ncbi:MAG: 3-deoxy-manno-octulosonate cytidylyltransferase [Deltaproteobacteria bacterium]|nr:MAG: 3-deoxy-manno-octulosonate cytidylyltransferase [Deltaproteobacteria bacterium]